MSCPRRSERLTMPGPALRVRRAGPAFFDSLDVTSAPQVAMRKRAPCGHRFREETSASLPTSVRRSFSRYPGASPMPRVFLVATLFLTLAASASAQEAKPTDPAPRQLTAQEDHKLMMEALR